MQVDLFPATAPGYKLTATSSGSTAQALPGRGNTLRIYNTSTTLDVYIRISKTGDAVTLASAPTTSADLLCPCPAGKDECFSIPSDQIYNISAYASSNVDISVAVAGGGV